MDINALQNIIKELSNGNNLGEPVTLVGATKMMDVDTINLAIKNGLKVVAENKVQEFTAKNEFIKDAEQHFIGHLQTNKVKYLVGKVKLIHSVDSVKLAEEISKFAVKRDCTQEILLEVNIGGELSKSGFTPEEINIECKKIAIMPNIKVVGLMAMLPNTLDATLQKKLCLQMREIFDTLKNEGLPFKNLSVGMSGDYKIAIENGSNMVRIGSLIFGKRNYGEEK